MLECMLALLTPSMLKIDENLNRIPPFTSYCCGSTNSMMMMSVTFSPLPSGSGSKAMYTKVFSLEMLGTRSMEERSPVADRNELVARGNRFNMPRCFSFAALTAMSVSPSGYSLRLLWRFRT